MSVVVTAIVLALLMLSCVAGALACVSAQRGVSARAEYEGKYQNASRN